MRPDAGLKHFLGKYLVLYFFSSSVLRKPLRLLSFSEPTFQFHFVLYKSRKRL